MYVGGENTPSASPLVRRESTHHQMIASRYNDTSLGRFATKLGAHWGAARTKWRDGKLSLLDGVLRGTDWLAPVLGSTRRKIPPLDWGKGVSVIIPERGSPDLL